MNTTHAKIQKMYDDMNNLEKSIFNSIYNTDLFYWYELIMTIDNISFELEYALMLQEAAKRKQTYITQNSIDKIMTLLYYDWIDD